MRCKVGDLVMVIKSTCGNEGRVGTVVRWVRFAEPLCDRFMAGQAGWLVSGRFRTIYEDGTILDGDPTAVLPDEWLIPLRDKPGQDETLTWKEVPTKPTEMSPKPQKAFTR